MWLLGIRQAIPSYRHREDCLPKSWETTSFVEEEHQEKESFVKDGMQDLWLSISISNILYVRILAMDEK